MHKLKHASFAITIGVILLVMGQSQRTAAQSTLARAASINDASSGSELITKKEDKPAALSTSPEIEELRRQMQELQERLQKLETKQSANAVATSYPIGGPSGAASSSTGQGSGTQDNTSKPAEPSDKDTDKGFLGFFRDTEVSGFVDGYYGYNFNRPFNHRNQLRNFDFKNNEFGLNLAELVLEKKPAEGSRIGYRLDLDFGAATDWVHSAEPGGVETYKHIQQAYGSFLAPVGKGGLQIDVGKFVTWNGAEVIETKDNWNYSRGFLFAWAIPYYHAGVRATYNFNSKVSLMGALVNGWNNVEDNNGGKTFGLSLTIKPNSKFTIIENYTGGPEQNDAVPTLANGNFWRHLYDTTLIYAFNPKVSVMGNYDYGSESERAGGKVHWQGLAAYLRYAPTPKWAFSPRFEWYDDHDGFTTCTEDPLSRCSQGKTFKEITLTGEYKFARNVIGRLEFRDDWANTPFFRKRTLLPEINPLSVLSRHQATILGGLIFTFSTHEQ